jgi:hypothetical protein
MSNLQASLKPLVHKDIQPHDLCSRLNRTLCEIMPENKFITLSMACSIAETIGLHTATPVTIHRFC